LSDVLPVVLPSTAHGMIKVFEDVTHLEGVVEKIEHDERIEDEQQDDEQGEPCLGYQDLFCDIIPVHLRAEREYIHHVVDEEKEYHGQDDLEEDDREIL
jgi:hypothetical protein